MESDDEHTSPDLGDAEEHTPAGILTGDGTAEAFAAVLGSARRAVDAIEALIRACPKTDDPAWDRHVQVIGLGAGDAGMAFFDLRRIAEELRRKDHTL